jgi:hypothetical protein
MQGVSLFNASSIDMQGVSFFTKKIYRLQRWAGPQLVPLCAFPQLAQQGNLLRMCALIHRQLTAELRLRTKKYSCGPFFHNAQYRR